MFNLPAHQRKHLTKEHHAIIFGLAAAFIPQRVITILLAPLGVAACGLEMPISPGTNPNFRPGRRDSQGFDPLFFFRVTDSLAVNPPVTKALTPTLALDARPGIADITQA